MVARYSSNGFRPARRFARWIFWGINQISYQEKGVYPFFILIFLEGSGGFAAANMAFATYSGDAAIFTILVSGRPRFFGLLPCFSCMVGFLHLLLLWI